MTARYPYFILVAARRSRIEPKRVYAAFKLAESNCCDERGPSQPVLARFFTRETSLSELESHRLAKELFEMDAEVRSGRDVPESETR